MTRTRALGRIDTRAAHHAPGRQQNFGSRSLSKSLVVAISLLACGIASAYFSTSAYAGLAPLVPRSFPDAGRVTINGVGYRVNSPNQTWSNLIGKYYEAFELQTDDARESPTHHATARSELAASNSVPYDTDVWLSFAMYLPSDSRLPTRNWAIAGQYHSSEDPGESVSTPPFAQYFNSGVFQVVTRSNPLPNNGGVNTPDVVQYSDPSFPRNTWVHFVYHLRFSQTGNGFLQAWREGQEIIPAVTMPIGYNDVRGPYWRYGVYRYKPATGTYAMHYANMEQAMGPAALADRIVHPLPIHAPKSA